MSDELAQAEIADIEAEADEDEATGLPEPTVALIAHE
jgi:hypothetical protein